MRTFLKAAVVSLPFLAAFLVVRSCAGGEARRWRDRAAAVDPAAVVGVDEEDLIVIAPDKKRARRAADRLRGFRRGLAEEYGELLGRPRRLRMVVVIFSSAERLRAYAGDRFVAAPASLHGYTDATYGAIFVPADDPRTLRHEVVHWVVGVAHPGSLQLSPWLTEGLAQLFESYDPDAVPPVPPGLHARGRGLVRAVLEEPIDVDRLIGLEDYASFVGQDGQRNYVEALVLTAFLFERRPRALLRRYIAEEGGTAHARVELFRNLYRNDQEPFQRDLRGFVR